MPQSSPPPSSPTLSFTLNGKPVRLRQESPTTTLLHYLNQSGSTGTKEGCGDGDCGACTVVIVGEGADGQPQYQAVNSCLIPLGSLAGREVITVEGVANGALHPVQAAMVETGGSQCGYCTPGFIMSLFAAYYDGVVDDASVEGNLCRCTGYLPIRRAAQQVTGVQPCDAFASQLSQSSPRLEPWSLIQAEQSFFRPGDVRSLLNLMAGHPTATLIAGGTDLGLELSHKRRLYPVMISLEAVAELQGISQTPDAVTIGAAVPLSQIEQTLTGVFPSLDTMLYWFAARQVRNRATMGGNLGTASPIGDLPPVLLSLDATLTLVSQPDPEEALHERTLPVADFFTGYRETVLQPGEVIRHVTLPHTLSAGAVRRLSQSYKVGKRGTDDISIVAAAFTVDLDGEDRVVQARLGYGGVAATPARAIAVEDALIGQPWSGETVRSLKPMLHDAFTPLSDLRGSASYRRRLVANLFEKFFQESQS
ncbi:MAG: xanthine dehydrogenase small subunit [Kaiparowitsia implicata GSE-PSE-MK54-09C]|nr:xanthine dehydrogenase small subunit [Kaiparowitsia implicata GSE-PSE-MK54-09C]